MYAHLGMWKAGIASIGSDKDITKHVQVDRNPTGDSTGSQTVRQHATHLVLGKTMPLSGVEGLILISQRCKQRVGQDTYHVPTTDIFVFLVDH
jgi:hypothetical protein